MSSHLERRRDSGAAGLAFSGDDALDRCQELLAGLGLHAADVDAYFGGVGDDIFGVAGLEGSDGEDGDVGGVDLSADNGLEADDDVSGHDGRVDGAMGLCRS